VTHHELAHVGELDAGAAPVDEGGADFSLQRLDAAREGWLRDVQRGGRPSEVAVVGEDTKVMKTTQLYQGSYLLLMRIMRTMHWTHDATVRMMSASFNDQEPPCPPPSASRNPRP
jgi:hypothetical protein